MATRERMSSIRACARQATALRQSGAHPPGWLWTRTAPGVRQTVWAVAPAQTITDRAHTTGGQQKMPPLPPWRPYSDQNDNKNRRSPLGPGGFLRAAIADCTGLMQDAESDH